jgi:hypothetical protein
VRHSLEHPLLPDLRVGDALDAYLEENGFDKALYDAKWTPASFLGVPVPVPNTRKHRAAIMRHDLHHVATGFGTDLAGEVEISAWEARRGFGNVGLYTTGIIAGLALVGLVGWPKRVVAAARAAGRSNLFRDDLAYDDLLAMTVGELRALLGVPPEGLVGARKLHDKAPSPRGGSPT